MLVNYLGDSRKGGVKPELAMLLFTNCGWLEQKGEELSGTLAHGQIPPSLTLCYS
jgi:hypothetical protein